MYAYREQNKPACNCGACCLTCMPKHLCSCDVIELISCVVSDWVVKSKLVLFLNLQGKGLTQELMAMEAASDGLLMKKKGVHWDQVATSFPGLRCSLGTRRKREQETVSFG